MSPTPDHGALFDDAQKCVQQLLAIISELQGMNRHLQKQVEILSTENATYEREAKFHKHLITTLKERTGLNIAPLDHGAHDRAISGPSPDD